MRMRSDAKREPEERHAGVKLVHGTDSTVYPHGDNARQFARMVRFGMAPIEAIRSATTDAAVQSADTTRNVSDSQRE